MYCKHYSMVLRNSMRVITIIEVCYCLEVGVSFYPPYTTCHLGAGGFILSKTNYLHTLVTMPMVKKARRVTAADKRQKAILKKKLTGEVYDENRPTLSGSDVDELIAFQAQFGKEAHEDALRMAGRPITSATDSNDGNKSDAFDNILKALPPNLDALIGRAQQPQKTTTMEREDMLDALRDLQPRTTK